MRLVDKGVCTRNVTAGPATYSVPNVTPYQENPMLDLNSENIRCGRNGAISGRESDVATVVAGDVVGFLPSSLVCRLRLDTL